MNTLPSYTDKRGVWMLYSYDAGPYVMQIDIDPVPLTRIAARQAYGSVGFWPFDMAFSDAVAWWEKREQHTLNDSIVHLFYLSTRFSQPICKESPSDEWIQWDHTAIGKICSDCQDRIGRKIS